MLLKKYSNYELECGIDEAGRGCLAGPVTAAAVILKPDFDNSLINDSKKLNANLREKLVPIIIENSICFTVKNVSPKKIDEINILNASILAMHKCIRALDPKPDFILVDGNKFKSFTNIPHKTIIKGDGKYLNIAAASILAKYYRDNYMKKIHVNFKNYGWFKNKGYPTKEHKMNILKNGLTKYHRISFKTN
jgi:ribonuclease HII